MSRAQLTSVTALVESREAGGYTLPDALVAAFDQYQAVKTVALPEPDQLDADTAAARLRADLAAGKAPDLAAAADQVRRAQDQQAMLEIARRVRDQAVEQASDQVGIVASDTADAVIAEHLRPAWAEVHDQTRKAAAQLKGHPLELGALIGAPTKVRDAYLTVRGLAERRSVILRARGWANSAGMRQPQHDSADMFALLEDPWKLFPDRKPSSRMPPFPIPDDDVAAMLWWGTDAELARPWLPTVAEQDAAWWKQFGESVEKIGRYHRDARAIGARIG